jgi:hypothetical protein
MHGQEKGNEKCCILMLVVHVAEDGLAKGWLVIAEGMEQEKCVLCTLLAFHVILWWISGLC